MDDKFLNGSPFTAAEGELPLNGAGPVFLSGSEIWNEVAASLASPKEVDLAVAYWGNGILDQIGDASWTVPTRIVCDLMSGFCHVDTIKRFTERKGPVRVKMRRRLHAKVYMTDASAVLGSANASAAGLGIGEQPNFEAAVRISDPFTLLSMRQWYEWLWATSHEITADDLKKAEEIAKAAAKARQEVNASKPEEHSSREVKFLERLSLEAYSKIMNYARANAQVTAVRFGMLGAGSQPNFMLIYSDGTRRSYHYPGQDGEPVEAQEEWSEENTTRPIPVLR
jgi:hypothetical protein